MKKVIGLIAVSIFIAAGFYIHNRQQSKMALSDRALDIRSSSLANTQDQADSVRKPASVDPSSKKNKKEAKIKRQWVGAKDDIIQSGKIAMKNTPDKNWQDKLTTILGRGLSSKTEIEINHEKSLVLVNGNDAVNAEQVVVIFNSDKERNSYRAMVNSQTGKVIRTWDHTIHENIRKPASLSGLPLTMENED